MKNIIIGAALILFPVLVWAQNASKDISGLSRITTKGSFSGRQLISDITNHMPSSLSAGGQQAGGASVLSTQLIPSGADAFMSLLSNISHRTNTVLINQVGNNNLARIGQTGSSNLAILKQAGNQITTVVNQDGTSNTFGSYLGGNNHYLKVSQLGNQNFYMLYYKGDKALDHTVVQKGNNLRAVQIGSGGKPFSIKEQGNGMKILIRHHSY